MIFTKLDELFSWIIIFVNEPWGTWGVPNIYIIEPWVNNFYTCKTISHQETLVFYTSIVAPSIDDQQEQKPATAGTKRTSNHEYQWFSGGLFLSLGRIFLSSLVEPFQWSLSPTISSYSGEGFLPAIKTTRIPAASQWNVSLSGDPDSQVISSNLLLFLSLINYIFLRAFYYLPSLLEYWLFPHFSILLFLALIFLAYWLFPHFSILLMRPK